MFPARPSSTSSSSATADREEQRAHARGLLLVLAANLKHLGLRARVVEEVLRPITLRVWKPQRRSNSAEMVASPRRVESGFVFVLVSDGAMGLPAAVVPADVPAVAARSPMDHPTKSGSITPARSTEEA